MPFILNDLLPGKEEIIGKLLPNGWEPLVIQLAATVVLVAAFFFFMFKPVRKIIKARQDHIVSNIQEAETKNQQAEDYLHQAHREVKSAKLQAQDIIKEAEARAEIVHDQVIAKAESEIRLLKTEADQDIEHSRAEASEDIKKNIIDVALEASKKILGREVDEKDNRRLVEDFIASLEEEDERE